MDKRLKRKEGFTLIEVIISVAIVSILSVGVYRGFIIILDHMSKGEQKQISALIGKKLYEDIRLSCIEGKIFLGENSRIFVSDDMNLDYSQENEVYYNNFYFGKNGDLSYEDKQCLYRAEIRMKPKKTEEGSEVGIKTFSVENERYLKLDEHTKKLDLNVTNDKIEIHKEDSKYIKHDFDKGKDYLYLDFKDCAQSVDINVNNSTKKSLKLYVLNSNYSDENICKVNISAGLVSVCYKSNNESKFNNVGILYEFEINVYNNNSNSLLYTSNLIQNVDISYHNKTKKIY